MTKVILYTDGAARGNPGPAAIGIVLTDAQGHELIALGECVGRTTNNVAEYLALLRGLDHAHTLAATEIEIRTDSELMAQQLRGNYRVRADHLKRLHGEAQSRLAQYQSVVIRHVPREHNRRADALANEALDRANGR